MTFVIHLNLHQKWLRKRGQNDFTILRQELCQIIIIIIFLIFFFIFAHNMMKFLDLFINFTHLANPKLPQWYGIRIKRILHWLLVCFVFVSSAMHACSSPLLDFTRPTCRRWHPQQKTAQLERSPCCSAPPPSFSSLEMSAERTLLCSSSSADHHLPAGKGIWKWGGSGSGRKR